MNTEIFVVSYRKDFVWLDWCLKSIKKFCEGFSGTTVLVPRPDAAALRAMGHDIKVRTFDEAPPPLGMMHHQAMNCCADVYCYDSDFVLHVDSDCILTDYVTPAEYFRAGKPILLIEEYARLGDRVPWQPIMSEVMGELCRYETMRRHPAVHYRELYGDCRNAIEKAHDCPGHFEEYILSLKPDFPQGFSEFNALGHIAISPKWRDRYAVIDLANEARPRDLIRQYWSHGPIDQEQSTPFGAMAVPIKEIRTILNQ